jgi:hypothetical protein
MEVLGNYGTIVRNGELADAMTVLGRSGRSADDYRIEVRLPSDTEQTGSAENFVRYLVSVIDLKTSRTLTFPGGPRHTWVRQLEQTLQLEPDHRPTVEIASLR